MTSFVLGDFNPRICNFTDLARDFDHDGSNLEIDSSAASQEKHNIIHRNTMDKEIIVIDPLHSLALWTPLYKPGHHNHFIIVSY